MSQPDFAADRQDMILDAAFKTFAAYGFRRTTMDDIARAAGLSRSALYLHFRNKDDIFRSLTARYFEETVNDMKEALSAPGQTPARALMAAFVAKDGKFMDIVIGTPHGRELLEAGFSTSADIAEAGEARMTRTLAEFLARHRIAPGVGTPEELAATLIAALRGLKGSATTLADHQAAQARLAALFGMALAPLS